MENIIFQNDFVYVSLIDNIGVIYLNNGKQNRICQPEFICMNKLDKLIKEYQIQALIITSNGKNFSLGADVSLFDAYKQNTEEFKELLNKGKQLLSYIENLPILTIALIKGACFGAGLEIALSCRFRFANNQALFSFPEVNLGLLPGLGGTVRLPKLIGKAKALEMILMGEIFGSEDALALKIVDQVVEKKQELESTISWIKMLITDKPSQQLTKIINAIVSVSDKDEEMAYREETDSFVELMLTSNL